MTRLLPHELLLDNRNEDFMATICYQNFKRELTNNPGESILETSLRHNIPHPHACGGHAVCSSCRVRLVEGIEHLAERNDKEQLLADSLGFTDDIRLACQTCVSEGSITIHLPVLDEIDIEIVSKRFEGSEIKSVGEQKHLSFLFADMEGFTSFTESTPPYDVVHVLNRYYHTVGRLVEENNGFIVDFFGDGFLAVFGVKNPKTHAIDAVKTGLAINQEMKDLNQYVEQLLGKTFKLRVGINSDHVILGTIGIVGAQKLSVIGDGVNFASRIESANKSLGTYFLISENTYQLVRDKVEIKGSHEISVKGKTGNHCVYEISKIR